MNGGMPGSRYLAKVEPYQKVIYLSLIHIYSGERLPWQRHAPHHLLALRLKWYRKLYRWHSNLHHQSGLWGVWWEIRQKKPK